ncbi:MAG: hypothetical protein ACI9NT_002735, partial [Bacteroidia bacterium]
DSSQGARIEGHTLRYPAGRPIHGLFVFVFPRGASRGSLVPGGVSSLKMGVAWLLEYRFQVFDQQRSHTFKKMFR